MYNKSHKKKQNKLSENNTLKQYIVKLSENSTKKAVYNQEKKVYINFNAVLYRDKVTDKKQGG